MPSLEFDLTPEMRRIGGWFRQELEANIRKQMDIDGKRFLPVKVTTAVSRQRRSNAIVRDARKRGVKGRIAGTRGIKKTKGIGSDSYKGTGGLDFKRLFFTKQFVKGAFRFIPRKDHVKVLTWPGTYPGTDVSFRDIVRWNNRGSSAVNRKILLPPKIFPVNESEVEKMNAFKQAVALLASERTQRKVVGRAFRKKISVMF